MEDFRYFITDLKNTINEKVDKNGWGPNKYLGTDNEGILVEKEEIVANVPDGSIDSIKLSSDIQKKIGVAELDVYGLTDDDYEAVDITDQFTPADYNTWDQSSNNGSGTVLSPIFKTPQKLVIINNNTSAILNRTSRFLNGQNTDSNVATTDTESYRSDRWASNILASETKTIYTYEFERSGREYMQIRWTNGSFSSWKGKFQVIAYYTDKRPEYEEISDSDGFEHDVDIRWGAAVCGNVGLADATLLAIVPFIPGVKYTVKGGNWINSASTNISNAYALYDDSLLNNYYPALGSNSGSIPIQPPYRNILSDMVVVESGATNGGKGIVTYTCPDPSETKDYPKWIAFAMSNAAKPTVGDTSIVYSYDVEMIQSWVNGRISMLDERKAGWSYVTRFDTLIDRPAKTTDFVNPYEYLDDGSSRYSALQAGSSPLCGAKWVLFGDSITDNYGGDTRIGDYFVSKISREFGLIPDNRAKSGSNINDGDEAYNNLCGINMLDTFLQEIEDETTEQPEYITIAYGHNSYSAHVGSVDDTSAEHTNSICGSMKYFIEKIREKCPGTVFGFVLPYQSDWAKSTAPNGTKDIAVRLKEIIEEYMSGHIIDGQTYYLNDVKLFHFMGGANDWSTVNGEINRLGSGSQETNPETLYGACNYIFGESLSEFPKADIVVTLQPVNYANTVPTDEEDAKNVGFDSLEQAQRMTDAQYSSYLMMRKELIVREMAERYGLTICDCCFDWYNPINPDEAVKYWQSDKLHLTADGHQAIIDKLEKVVNNMRVRN